ncbi:hypothetical protein D9M68_770050 [compost metagenome]
MAFDASALFQQARKACTLAKPLFKAISSTARLDEASSLRARAMRSVSWYCLGVRSRQCVQKFAADGEHHVAGLHARRQPFDRRLTPACHRSAPDDRAFPIIPMSCPPGAGAECDVCAVRQA